MKYYAGDIVRFIDARRIVGLHEVSGYGEDGEITVTNDECNSEFYADEDDLILVCSVDDRKDI